MSGKQNNKRKEDPPKEGRKPRRNPAAQALEHLIPGGKHMSDADLEITLDWLLRRPR